MCTFLLIGAAIKHVSNNKAAERILFNHTTYSKPVAATADIGRSDTRRIEAQVVHTRVTVPRRRPVEADATPLTGRSTTEEVASESKSSTTICNWCSHKSVGIIFGIKGLELSGVTTSWKTPSGWTDIVCCITTVRASGDSTGRCGIVVIKRTVWSSGGRVCPGNVDEFTGSISACTRSFLPTIKCGSRHCCG